MNDVTRIVTLYAEGRLCFRSRHVSRSTAGWKEASAYLNGATTSAAFTLIELLVVLGIMANLAALILPALGKAKASAQKIACANNLKQLQLAEHLYADDFGGWILGNGDWRPPGASADLPTWSTPR